MIVSSAWPEIVDRLDQALLLVGQRGLEQQPRHPDDAVHRLADLVAHGREEDRLRLVGTLRHAGPLPPSFELAAERGRIARQLRLDFGQVRFDRTVDWHGLVISRACDHPGWPLFP